MHWSPRWHRLLSILRWWFCCCCCRCCWLLLPLWGSVFVPCFVVHCFVSFLVLQLSWQLGCFILFVFLMSCFCYCSVALQGCHSFSISKFPGFSLTFPWLVTNFRLPIIAVRRIFVQHKWKKCMTLCLWRPPSSPYSRPRPPQVEFYLNVSKVCCCHFFLFFF